MLTRARASILVLAALTLGACGNIHPGDAAVVDGQSISMETLNKTAKIYCTLSGNAAEQQGGPAVSGSDVRRQAVTSLVSVVVARKLARSEGVTVDPVTYNLTAGQEEQLAKAFPGRDIAKFSQAIEESQEVAEIGIALAEKSTRQVRNSTNERQLSQAGQLQIVKAFPANGVRFAPRFGLSPSTKAIADTGSLSVGTGTAPTGADLPVAQRCT